MRKEKNASVVVCNYLPAIETYMLINGEDVCKVEQILIVEEEDRLQSRMVLCDSCGLRQVEQSDDEIYLGIQPVSSDTIKDFGHMFYDYCFRNETTVEKVASNFEYQFDQWGFHKVLTDEGEIVDLKDFCMSNAMKAFKNK